MPSLQISEGTIYASGSRRSCYTWCRICFCLGLAARLASFPKSTTRQNNHPTVPNFSSSKISIYRIQTEKCFLSLDFCNQKQAAVTTNIAISKMVWKQFFIKSWYKNVLHLFDLLVFHLLFCAYSLENWSKVILSSMCIFTTCLSIYPALENDGGSRLAIMAKTANMARTAEIAEIAKIAKMAKRPSLPKWPKMAEWPKGRNWPKWPGLPKRPKKAKLAKMAKNSQLSNMVTMVKKAKTLKNDEMVKISKVPKLPVLPRLPKSPRLPGFPKLPRLKLQSFSKRSKLALFLKKNVCFFGKNLMFIQKR